MTRPFSSSIPCTSQPLTKATPVCSKKGWRRSKRVPYTRLGLTVIRKQTSCFRSPAGKKGQVNEKSRNGNQNISFSKHNRKNSGLMWCDIKCLPSHSCLMWSLTLRLTVTSARTRAGQLSPMLGFATSTMEKEVICWAILAQPPNTTPPYSDCLCRGTKAS